MIRSASVPPTARVWQSIGRPAALSVFCGSLVFAVLLLCLRRAMGALFQPLPTPLLVAVLAIALFATIAVRGLWLAGGSDHVFVRWLPTLLMLLLALALWLPGTSLAGATVLCAGVVVDSCAAVVLQAGMGPVIRKRFEVPADRDAVSAVDGGLLNRHTASDCLPREISQRFTRRRVAEGGEIIDGEVRTAFAPGQRTEHCHVAFCPPLDGVLRVACEQTEGPPARIKVAQVLPQGARLDLRLDQPAEEEVQVVLQVTACSQPPHQPRTQA